MVQPNIDPRIPEPTVGKALLRSRGMFVDGYWYWICVGVLMAFSLLFNIFFIATLAYLDRKLFLLILTCFSHGRMVQQ